MRLSKRGVAYIYTAVPLYGPLVCKLLHAKKGFSPFYFLCIHECFVCMCKWIMFMHCLWGPEEGIRPQELQLEVVGNHVGAWSQIWALCKHSPFVSFLGYVYIYMCTMHAELDHLRAATRILRTIT